jgi:hypothetical protein
MSVTKVGVQPHVEKIVDCVCTKKYCAVCMERCPRCYGIHIKPVKPVIRLRS